MFSTQVMSNSWILESAKEDNNLGVVGYLQIADKQYEVGKGDTKIGRDPSLCSIVIDNNTVSKLHCVIESDGKDDTFIYDAGSTNQTKLGQKWCKPHCRYKLENENLLTFGNVTAKFITFLESDNNSSPSKPIQKNNVSLGERSYSKQEDIFDLETQCNIPSNLFKSTIPLSYTSQQSVVSKPSNLKNFTITKAETSKAENGSQLRMIKNSNFQPDILKHTECLQINKDPKIINSNFSNSYNVSTQSIFDAETQGQVNPDLLSKAVNITHGNTGDLNIFNMSTQYQYSLNPENKSCHEVLKQKNNSLELKNDKVRSNNSENETQGIIVKKENFYEDEGNIKLTIPLKKKIMTPGIVHNRDCYQTEKRNLLNDGEDDFFPVFTTLHSQILSKKSQEDTKDVEHNINSTEQHKFKSQQNVEREVEMLKKELEVNGVFEEEFELEILQETFGVKNTIKKEIISESPDNNSVSTNNESERIEAVKSTDECISKKWQNVGCLETITQKNRENKSCFEGLVSNSSVIKNKNNGVIPKNIAGKNHSVESFIKDDLESEENSQNAGKKNEELRPAEKMSPSISTNTLDVESESFLEITIDDIVVEKPGDFSYDKLPTEMKMFSKLQASELNPFKKDNNCSTKNFSELENLKLEFNSEIQKSVNNPISVIKNFINENNVNCPENTESAAETTQMYNKIATMKCFPLEILNLKDSSLICDGSPSLLSNESSQEDSQDFIGTQAKEICAQKIEMVDVSENMETTQIEGEENNQTNATMALTKDINSFVPESSDDDDTESDLEMIEDTPYLKERAKSKVFTNPRNNWVKEKGVTRSLGFDCIFEDSNERNKEDSDSSYVFEVEQENKIDKVKDWIKEILKNEEKVENSSVNIKNCGSSESIRITDKISSTKSNSCETQSVTQSVLGGDCDDRNKNNNDTSNSMLWQVINYSSDSDSSLSVILPNTQLFEENTEKFNEKTKNNRLKQPKDSEITFKSEITENMLLKDSFSNITELCKYEPQSFNEFVVKASKRTRDIDSINDNDISSNKKSRTGMNLDIFFNLPQNTHEEESLNLKDENQFPRRSTRNNTAVKLNYNLDLGISKIVDEKFKQRPSKIHKNSVGIRKQENKPFSAVVPPIIKKAESKRSSSNFRRTSRYNKNVVESNVNKDNSFRVLREREKSKDNEISRKSNLPSVCTRSSLRKREKIRINESYFGSLTPNIVFTGVCSQLLENIVDKLKGVTAENILSGSVLVTDKVRRTIKFLCAIGLSLPVTSPQWLLTSEKEKKFLNPWDFLLHDVESEKKWNFNLKTSLKKAKNKKLLEGYSVFATKSINPPVKDLLEIVQCNGGTPLRVVPETWPKNTIFVSCLEDKYYWPLIKCRQVKVVSSEFILSGVLQQALDMKAFSLRLGS